MRQSLYKSIINYLKSQSKLEIKGHHLNRLNKLAYMIVSSMRTKSSSLEGLSLGLYYNEEDDDRQSESLISNAKRWLSSKWTDWDSFYAPYIVDLLGAISNKGELVLVIDGSETGGDCVTLMLSAIWRGYAIPLVWLTRVGKKGHFPEQLHVELIGKVATILPDNCRKVLLGDGEFDGLRLRNACKSMNWEFVLRTSKDRKIDDGVEVMKLGELYPNDNEEIVFVQDACNGDNAILWKGTAYRDPIPLLTNMDLGGMACEYYRRRFKIETLFKTLKSDYFNLQKSKICGAEKISNLVLVIALSFIFCFCIGLILKENSKTVLQKIIRFDKITLMSPIVLAKKCLLKDPVLAANNLFLILAKNMKLFFSDS
jgi:hypothetical protein